MNSSIVAGALYDFLGYLTTRPKPTTFGAAYEATFAVELLSEWAAFRGLYLGKPAIENWTEALDTLLAPQAPSRAKRALKTQADKGTRMDPRD
jgi:hypothetical protein